MNQAVVNLLKLRFRLWWNELRHGNWKQKIGYAFAAIGMLVSAGFLLFVSWMMLRLITDPEVLEAVRGSGLDLLVQNLVDLMPVFFGISALLGGIFLSFGMLLQTLYLAGDMEFLLSAPIPTRAVFMSKLIQAALPNLIIIGLFSGPALMGLGLSQGFTFLYYWMVPVILAVLVLAGAGLGSMLVMLVVRLVAPRRAAEVLGLIGGLTAVVCAQSGQFAGRFEGGLLPAERMEDLVGAAGLLVNPLNPLAWPGLGLNGIGRGEWLAGLGFSGLTLVITLGIFAAALTMAERLYLSGWARVQIGTTARRRQRRGGVRPDRSHRVLGWLAAGLPRPVKAMILKDVRVYRRDLRNLSQLVFPIVMVVVWTVSALRMEGGTEEASLARDFGPQMSVGIALFLGWMFLGRFGMMSFSSEGRHWWIVKTAPIREVHLLLAKYLVAFLPPVVFSVVYLFFMGLVQQVSLFMLLYQLVVTLVLMASLTGLMLAFGIWSANFEWDDPRRVGGGASGCVGSLASLALLGLGGGAFVGMPLLLNRFGISSAVSYGLGFTTGVVVSLLGGGIPLLIAKRKLPRLGEPD